jgi:hypothetical protein
VTIANFQLKENALYISIRNLVAVGVKSSEVVGAERKKKNNNTILNHNYLQGLREVNDNKERINVGDCFLAIIYYLLIILIFVKRCSWREL